MKLLTDNKTYASVSFAPEQNGCTIVCGELIVVGDTLRVEDDEGVLLREYAVADYLRCVVDGCTVRLTNMPEIVPEPPAPPEPTPEDVNAQAIAELSTVIAQNQSVTEDAIAELTIMLAGGAQ